MRQIQKLLFSLATISMLSCQDPRHKTEIAQNFSTTKQYAKSDTSGRELLRRDPLLDQGSHIARETGGRLYVRTPDDTEEDIAQHIIDDLEPNSDLIIGVDITSSMSGSDGLDKSVAVLLKMIPNIRKKDIRLLICVYTDKLIKDPLHGTIVCGSSDIYDQNMIITKIKELAKNHANNNHNNDDPESPFDGIYRANNARPDFGRDDRVKQQLIIGDAPDHEKEDKFIGFCKERNIITSTYRVRGD